VDGSDADEIGFSALSVREFGTPSFGNKRTQHLARLAALLRKPPHDRLMLSGRPSLNSG
jgi:hypothetical protein